MKWPLPKPTRHNLLSATLATALALSPLTASPARAGNDEQIGALAFGSILGLITAGVVISSLNQNRPHTQPVPTGPQPGVGPRKILPGYCKFSVPYGANRGTYFGRQCLIRNFSYWPSLPRHCGRWVNQPARSGVKAYRARCLAREGYVTGGPRR